jgi:hypothetical protein
MENTNKIDSFYENWTSIDKFKTKAEKRELYRDKLSKKWVKHNYWDEWRNLLELQIKNSSKMMKEEMILKPMWIKSEMMKKIKKQNRKLKIK